MKSPKKGGRDPARLTEIKGDLADSAPAPIDRHVGARLRFRRETLGISVAELAMAAGLTEPLLRKLERGSTRVSARRLHEFGRLLDVPPSFFFESDEASPPDDGLRVSLRLRETELLLSAFLRISDRATRQRLIEFANGLASGAAWPAVWETTHSRCSG